MSIYDRQIASAKKAILKKGQSVTWNIKVDGESEDTDKPWAPTESESSGEPVTIVFLPTSELTKFYRSYSEIPKGAVMGLMAAVSFTPSVKDTMTRDGVDYTINNMDILAPDGEAILYTIEFNL